MKTPPTPPTMSSSSGRSASARLCTRTGTIRFTPSSPNARAYTSIISSWYRLAGVITAMPFLRPPASSTKRPRIAMSSVRSSRPPMMTRWPGFLPLRVLRARVMGPAPARCVPASRLQRGKACAGKISPPGGGSDYRVRNASPGLLRIDDAQPRLALRFKHGEAGADETHALAGREPDIVGLRLLGDPQVARVACDLEAPRRGQA